MYYRMCISKRTISAHQTHPGVCIQSLQLAVRLSHTCAITGVFSGGGEVCVCVCVCVHVWECACDISTSKNLFNMVITITNVITDKTLRFMWSCADN